MGDRNGCGVTLRCFSLFTTSYLEVARFLERSAAHGGEASRDAACCAEAW